MDDGITTIDLLRLVGVMAVCVGLAWAVQILGFSADGTAISRMIWVLGAAMIAGAGAGSIYTASAMQDEDDALGA